MSEFFKRLALLLLGSLLWSVGVHAQSGPRRNLWVEIRWVDSSLSNAALSGVRDAAVVVGTSGSVSPRGGVVLSTRSENSSSSQQMQQRLLVLNGSTARVRLSEQVPVQWVDYGLQLDTGTAGGMSAGSGPPSTGAGKVMVVPRSGSVEMVSEFSVTPQWPGDRQPVRVSVQVQQGRAGSAGEPALPNNPPTQAQAQQQMQVQSTVLLPLGEWLTIARSGQRAQTQERGTLSSRDAEGRVSRDLQIRVELAP